MYPSSRRPASALVLFVLSIGAAACGGGADAATDTTVPALETTTVVTSELAEASPAETTTTEVDPIFSANEFGQVCRGTGMATATAYTPGVGLHPVVALDGVDPEYSMAVVTLPDGWHTRYETFETTQIVACLDRIAEVPGPVCEGYEDADSGLAWSVQPHDATWAVTLRSALTAEVLAETTLEAVSTGCPTLSFYTEGDPIPVAEYARPSAELEVFLRPFVTGA